MTNEELDALERLCEAATPGEWSANVTTFDSDGLIIAAYVATGPIHRSYCGDDCDYIDCRHRCGNGERDKVAADNDAAFIAAARHAVPQLVSEVRRLRTALIETLAALENGSGATDAVSTDFLCRVPHEARSEVRHLRATLAEVTEQRNARADEVAMVHTIVADTTRSANAWRDSARAWSRRWKAAARDYRHHWYVYSDLYLDTERKADQLRVDLAVTREVCANLARRVDELVRERQQREAERDAMRAVVAGRRGG